MPVHTESTPGAFRKGLLSGIPIFVGYFPAAVAFGLLSGNGGLGFSETLLFSMINFAGASQFLALNLYLTGSAFYEIIVGVFLVNLRYLLMSASLRPKIRASFPARAAVAFGNTDEVFSVASTINASVTPVFMAGIESIAWLGWVSGTFTGFLFGSVLPEAVQLAVGGTLYALFAALLVPEVKKETRNLLIAALAAVVNSVLVYGAGISVGWSFVVALLSASVYGALNAPVKEVV